MSAVVKLLNVLCGCNFCMTMNYLREKIFFKLAMKQNVYKDLEIPE